MPIRYFALQTEGWNPMRVYEEHLKYIPERPVKRVQYPVQESDGTQFHVFSSHLLLGTRNKGEYLYLEKPFLLILRVSDHVTLRV